MKIGYLIVEFPVLSMTFITDEIRELKRLGYDVDVFSFGEPASKICHPDDMRIKSEVYYYKRLFARYKWLNTKLFFYYLIKRPLQFISCLWISLHIRRFRLYFQTLAWARLAEQRRIEHFHIHFARTAACSALFISRLSGIPFSLRVYAEDIYRYIPDRGELEYRYLAKASAFQSTVSEFNRQQLVQRFPYLAGENIHVIYNPTDLRKFEYHPPIRKELFHIAAVGRLVPKKGFAYLIRACSWLRKHGIAFRCDILGEGEERTSLQRELQQHSLEGYVNLLGAGDSEAVKELLIKCDVFVLPCVIDSNRDIDDVPVVLKEAMAVGRPVIASKISGIPELIHNGSGMLVPPEDPDTLAGALTQMHYLGHEARMQMGRHGRSTLERQFNVVSETENLTACFRKNNDRIPQKNIQK